MKAGVKAVLAAAFLVAIALIFLAARPGKVQDIPRIPPGVPPDAAGDRAAGSRDSANQAVVSRVIDGDTLEAGGRIIRFLGMDAPEKGRCFYEEASAELKRLALGQKVRLEPDPSNDDVDEYGRTLRYAYLPDGTLLNARLIAGGFARYLSWFPIERNEEFAALEAEAQEKKLGLWARCYTQEIDAAL